MKYIFILILFFLSFGCGNKEPKNLNIFDPEIFYISLSDNSWEVTFKVKAEGVEQKKEENNYSVDVVFSVDLIYPDNARTNDLIIKQIIEKFPEKQEPYVNFEVSSELFKKGIYNAVIKIKDNSTGMKSEVSKQFEIK